MTPGTPNFWRLICATFALFCVALLNACATAARDAGVRWYAPATWFSHAPAAAADRAQQAAVAARQNAAAAKDDGAHAAHLEFAKAEFVFAALPPSRDGALGLRFLRNGLGLYDQIDPLAAVELRTSRQLVAALRGDSEPVRANAEKSQTAIEAGLAKKSAAITAAEARADLAEKKSAAKDAALRAAFERENALANELRTERVRFWAAVVGVLLLAVVAIYVRLQLSGVGAALHTLEPATLAAFLPTLDAHVVGSFAQSMVHRGRTKAAELAARLREDAAHLFPSASP